jgi:ABC-type multidrug transport system permease subunit
MFAVSNGLLVSSSFVLAPSLLPHDGMQERMSEILQFALSLGLLAGSFFSLYVLMFMP